MIINYENTITFYIGIDAKRKISKKEAKSYMNSKKKKVL
jgi:hypothetical protein